MQFKYLLVRTVTPPRTQLGMVAKKPDNLPNTPITSSQMAAANPDCRDAQRVRLITPLFCDVVVFGLQAHSR